MGRLLLSIVILGVGLGGLFLGPTACGDGGTEPDPCAFSCPFRCNGDRDLCFGPCGAILSNRAISAEFSCSQEGGCSWRGSATASYNNLGQIVSYSATINGRTCTGP